MKRKWMWLLGLAAVLLVVSAPDLMAQSGSCSWVDAGSGMGGWYDSSGQPCTPDTSGGEPMSTGEYQAWLTLSWWLFVIGFFILTGVPL